MEVVPQGCFGKVFGVLLGSLGGPPGPLGATLGTYWGHVGHLWDALGNHCWRKLRFGVFLTTLWQNSVNILDNVGYTLLLETRFPFPC